MPLLCSAPGCTSERKVTGLCKAHYHRVRYAAKVGREVDLSAPRLKRLFAREQRQCVHCGARFECVPSSLKRFCGTVCAGAINRDERRCQNCLQAFWRRSNGRGSKDRRLFCSRECANDDQAIHAPRASKWAELAENAAKREPCRICGVLTRALTCSEAHAARWALISICKYTQPRTCQVCAVEYCALPFTPSRGVCSESCARDRSARQKRTGKLKRRARIAGNGPVEDIDPYVVFDRDNWACQRCGCRTPPSLRGTHVADAPELDHIVPLARGGTHTFDNVQLLCRQCNNRKSDTLEDEATERSQAEK